MCQMFVCQLTNLREPSNTSDCLVDSKLVILFAVRRDIEFEFDHVKRSRTTELWSNLSHHLDLH